MQELKARTRKELGRAVKSLRKNGFLPAVIYGEKVTSQPLSVAVKDFIKISKTAGESTLVKLQVTDIDTHKVSDFNVLIYDIKRHPLNSAPLHADFYAVRMDKAVKAKIPVILINESPAVKNEGGIVVKVMQEIEVEALPQDLPHQLEVDISMLESLKSRLTIKNIKIPKNVKLLASPEETVVLIETPRSEEDLKSLEEAPVQEAITQIKTEKELKKELTEKKAEEEKIAEEEK